MKLQVIPYPGDIGDAYADGFRGQLEAAAQRLVKDAGGRLDPRADVLDGIVVVQVQEFLAQDRDLGEHLVHRELMLHLHPDEVIPHPTDEGDHRRVRGTDQLGAGHLGCRVGHGARSCVVGTVR